MPLHKTKFVFSMWLVFLLTGFITLGVTYLISQDWLVAVSVVLVQMLALLVLIRSFYVNWILALRYLQRFVDEKKQGQENVRFSPKNPNHPISELGFNVEQIFESENQQEGRDYLYTILSNWPFPVALFDQDSTLVFFNSLMFDAIQMPLLKGMQATECGFSFAQNKWSHIGLGKDWQTQSFKLNNGSETLIVANHIGQSLQSARYESNLSLIRVLTHELNNSLTPFISITDTLLAEPALPLEATRSALSRIKSRSESLLSFIHGYRELTKIAPATWAFFDLKEMVLLNAKEQGLAVTYSGYDTCCGDGILMEQFLINLFINAKEAKANAIQLEFLTKGKMQYLSIVDNGPGFSNLDNVLQPLYTTKADGQGLGLALCNTISHQHDGQLDVSNASPNGAKIQFTFPIRCR